MRESSHFIAARLVRQKWPNDVVDRNALVLVIERARSQLRRNERCHLSGSAEGKAMGALDNETRPIEVVAMGNATQLGHLGRHRSLEQPRFVERSNDSGEIRQSTATLDPSNHRIANSSETL